MRPLNIKEINKLHSPTWVACNDNSKSKLYRNQILSEYGGEFIKDGKYLKWQEIPPIKKIYVPVRLLKILNPSGKCIEIDNMTAMYEVIRGVRKSHKGYRAHIIPVE